MVQKIFIFTLLAVVWQVQSQICVGSTVTSPQLVPTGQYVAPQVIATPVFATTIVDNSVSNALANALQLLIVSELIESKLSNAPIALLNTLAPILGRIGPIYDAPCCPPVEVIPPCVPVIETIAPCYETVTPIYGGYTETFCGNPFVTETIVPNYYGGFTETITPTPCGIADIITPNIAFGPNCGTLGPNVYSGVTEVISTGPCGQYPVNNIFGGYTEVIAPCATPPYIPNCYGGITEVAPITFNSCGCGVTEVINPYNYYGGVEVISPISSFSPGCITEIINPTSYIPSYYGGLTEVISPFNNGCNCGVTEVIAPSFSPFYAEVVTPVNPFNPGCISEVLTPNFFGVNEFIAPNGPYGPVAAEVLIPPAIPAQLTCNFGYMPTTVPCVSFNVETLPFEPCGCGCNAFPKGFYY